MASLGVWSDRPLELLRTGGPEARLSAAKSLRHLASTGAEHGRRMVREGVLAPLLELLRDGPPSARLEAAGALRSLSFNSEEHQEAIVDAGALELLVDLLRSEDVGLPEQVAGTLMNLTESSVACRRALVGLGAIPILVGVIRRKVVIVGFVVHNVFYDRLMADPEAQGRFLGIVRRAVAIEVGSGLDEEFISVALSPSVQRHMAVQRPAVQARCTATVGGRADAAALQSALRASSALLEQLTAAFMDSKLEANPLRPIEVDSLSTPASILFDLQLQGLDLAKVSASADLRGTMELCAGSAVEYATGGAAARDGVQVTVSPESGTAHCVVTPARSTDATHVLRHLELGAPQDFAKSVASALEAGPFQSASRPATAQGDEGGGAGGPLAEAIVGPLGASLEGGFRLVESLYELSGTRAAQRQAAGALKNLIIGEQAHRSELVEEGGVGALVALLTPYVPLGDVYQAIDLSKNGSISRDEFETGLLVLGYTGSSAPLWRVLDSDGSGELSWDEFVDRLKEEFARRMAGRGDLDGPASHFLTWLDGKFDSSAVQEEAAGALRNLVLESAEFAEVVIGAGAVPPLIELMRSPSPEVREAANRALKVLAPSWAAKFVRALGEGESADRAHAARTLRKLAALNADHRRTVGAAGAIVPLIGLLGAGCAKCHEQACGALITVLYKNGDHEKLAVQSGLVPALVPLIRAGATSAAARSEALKCTAMLVDSTVLTQRRIVDAGGLEAFVELLKTGAPAPDQRRAVDCLAKLSVPSDFRRRFVQADVAKAAQDFSNTTDDAEAEKLAEELLDRLIPDRHGGPPG